MKKTENILDGHELRTHQKLQDSHCGLKREEYLC